jgi:Cu(I)/Ag(I) efflux system membrane protein CusA/SilA
LGGLLIADEVIDVFLPVLYFAVQKRRWRKLHGMSLLDEVDQAREEAASALVP